MQDAGNQFYVFIARNKHRTSYQQTTSPGTSAAEDKTHELGTSYLLLHGTSTADAERRAEFSAHL